MARGPDTPAPTPSTVGCPATTSAAQVTCDLAEWRTALAQRLPLGTGSVARVANANGGQRVRIVIRWREGRDDTPDVNDPNDFIRFETETQL